MCRADFHLCRVQSVHTMAIHPNTQVGCKLLLCSAGRGPCHLQAKLSKLQRHHDTEAKTTSKLLLSWTTAEIFTSANQKVHTCSFLPTHTTTYKNKLLCLHIKITRNLGQHRGRSLKKAHCVEKHKWVDASKPSKQPYCSHNICCQSRIALPSSWGTICEIPPPLACAKKACTLYVPYERQF